MIVSFAGDVGRAVSNYLWRLRHNTARPDIVGTDQPQPVDALGVGEVCRGWRFGVHASPVDRMDQLEDAGKGINRDDGGSCPIPTRSLKAVGPFAGNKCR